MEILIEAYTILSSSLGDYCLIKNKDYDIKLDILLKLFPTSTKPHVKLNEEGIKWIIREKEKETPTKLIVKIEGITKQRIKSDIQAIQER